MPRLFIFGLGYTATFIANRLRGENWHVTGTSREGSARTVAFGDTDRVCAEIAAATHLLSSIPPTADGDPVLGTYAGAVERAHAWRGYLSSTGVYGDAGGAWVDEGAPIGTGRRQARSAADAAWLALGARVFRLPGIYGPGRSPFDRIADGRAHLVDMPDQVFSRVHVDDIVAGVIAGFDGPPGAYNLADDHPAAHNTVMLHAARLLRCDPPPVVPLASLSPKAQGFYAENRRVANGKAKRVLGWAPAYPDYRAGLRALKATISPVSTSSAPITASTDQR